MKIEIVPEGNKTKKEGGGFDFAFIFDMIFGKLGSFVDSIFENVVAAMEEAVSGTIRRVLAAAIGVVGLCFLLSGVADVLDYLYFVPGLGAIIVGAIVVLVAVILALSAKRRK
jgi:hypothetical protein